MSSSNATCVGPTTNTDNSTLDTQQQHKEADAAPSLQASDKWVEVDATPYTWAPPIGYEQHVYVKHAGEGSQYLRDFILGVNDGLLSNLLLVLGMVGGGASHIQILLTGIVGGIAGMISMGIGEFIATKSQREVTTNDVELEREHLRFHRGVEIEQCREYLGRVGLDGALREAVIKQIGDDDAALLKVMEKFEFGTSEEDLQRSPYTAMFMSGRLYLLGSLPSILPFISSNITIALSVSLVLCAVAAFTIGAYKTRTTRGNWLYGGTENLLIAAIGAGVSYGIGVAFQTIAQKAFHASITTG